MATTSPRLYFAYGSNLSLQQMKSRCPTSTYHSLAVLKKYRWVIGERGYANVIKSQNSEDIVYGLLYTLLLADEEKLDIAEGVPYAYYKRELDVEVIEREGGGGKGEVVKALVYVDEKRLGEGVCKEEYVARMNRGMRDAVKRGMEKSWVEKVIRLWVREEDVGGEVRDPFHPSHLEGYKDEDLGDDLAEELGKIERCGINISQEL